MDESEFPSELPPFPDAPVVEEWKNSIERSSAELRNRPLQTLDEAFADYEKSRSDYSMRMSEYYKCRRQLQEEELRQSLWEDQEQNGDQGALNPSAGNVDLIEYEQRLITARKLAGDSLLKAQRTRDLISDAYSQLQLRAMATHASPVPARRPDSSRLSADLSIPGGQTIENEDKPGGRDRPFKNPSAM
jgi:hypothetical protein